MQENTQYKNPPIKNVLCEFRPFQEADGWSDVFIGQIYDKLKDEYPSKEDVLSLFRLNIQENISVEHKKETKMKSLEGNDIFVSQPRLAYNLGQRYPGWKIIKPKIMKAWQVYKSVLNLTKLQQIVLKYRNEILIPFDKQSEQIEERDYFNVYAEYKNINSQCIRPEINLTFRYGENEYLSVNLIGIVKDKATVAFLFELSYIIANCNNLSEENISSLLEKAHTNIEEAFEHSITDKLREGIFNK